MTARSSNAKRSAVQPSGVDGDGAVSGIAAAIGDPGRARMLYLLMDGRARTSTELAAVAEVSASTASAHLNRLRAENLVKVLLQGRHRYYSLNGSDVAAALEALQVLAGAPRHNFVPSTPEWLRAARTCYDHIAGALGVALRERIQAHGWLSGAADREANYALSPAGEDALAAIGVDVAAARRLRRRFACACVDWSERRPHIGGALGAALLDTALRRKWVTRDPGERTLEVTRAGRRELQARLDLRI